MIGNDDWVKVTGWNLLPDSLLVSIFLYLDAKSLAAVSEVCWDWSRVSKDNSLWRRRMVLDFKINPRASLSEFTADGSWLNEYRRLNDDFPVLESETLSHHTDEVLHVAFSNDGTMFATCSKDCTVKIWQSSYPCRLLYDKDMAEMFQWKYTQFSQFNSDDTLILVSGVLVGPTSTSGEIAVYEFKDDDIKLRSRRLNVPYDVFGCWYDDDHVISGELHWITQISSTSDIFLRAASQEIESERKPVMARLFKFLNRNANAIRMALISSHVSLRLRYAAEMPKKFVEAENAGKEFDSESFEIWEQACGAIDAVGSNSESWSDKLLVFCTGALTYTPHQVGFKLLRGKAIGRIFEAQDVSPERVQTVLERSRLQSESNQNAQNDHEEAEIEAQDPEKGHDPQDANWNENLEIFDFPDHVIEMNGHIIGMTLTRDQRYLFVNVRPWPDGSSVSDPLEPPDIAQQIEVRVVDLDTLTLLDMQYQSHKGFTTKHECFFIFLDACDQFVASGSEDSHAYVWDRHYGCVLGKLPHASCVNSVVFHPKNSSLLLSASDDYTLKVWRSKSLMREMSTKH